MAEEKNTFVRLNVVAMKIYHGYDEVETLKGQISIKENPFNFSVRSKEGRIKIYSKPEFGYSLVTMDETDTDKWIRVV